MEYFDNIPCVSYSELVDFGVVTESNYDNLRRRGKIEVARRACKGTPALIKFDSLPERLKERVMAEIGNPYKKIHVSIVQQVVMQDPSAREFFDTYKLEDGRLLPPAVREEYYTNAILLQAALRISSDNKLRRMAMGAKKTNLWPTISEAINELDKTRYPHTLPTNERRLRDKAAIYSKEGNESLIHKSYCNKYAAKVDDDIKESLLNTLIADPRNLDNEQVRALYNQIAEKMAWKMITRQAVSVWRDKLELVTYAGRRGATQLKANRAMQVKRSRPTMPLYYWTADGWDAELMYQKTEENKQGKVTTTYHNRLTIVVVLDPCINYPIGYAIGTHETPELIAAAFRNAADHTKELFGRRYRAHQLQTDNYAKKALTPIYSLMSKHYTPAEVKNAKAKVIEPYFKSINKKYCQMMPNWSGFGVTSKKDNQPNTDALNQFKKHFPDEEGARKQLEMVIAAERSAKVEEYLKLWNELPEEDKLVLSDELYLSYFGQATDRTIQLEPSGLRPTLLGVKREYDSFDISFRQHGSTRWVVKYNPDDLSTILAESEDGQLRYILQAKYVQPMALKERSEGDAKALQAVREYNKEMYTTITETRALADGRTHELLEDPRLKDTLAKHLIVDSRGQHKNYLKEGQKSIEKPMKRIKESAVDHSDDDENEIDLYKIM